MAPPPAPPSQPPPSPPPSVYIWSFRLVVAGEVADFLARYYGSYQARLVSVLLCFEPHCAVELAVSAGSVLLDVTVTHAAFRAVGDAAFASVAQVRGRVKLLLGLDPNEIAASLCCDDNATRGGGSGDGEADLEPPEIESVSERPELFVLAVPPSAPPPHPPPPALPPPPPPHPPHPHSSPPLCMLTAILTLCLSPAPNPHP